MPIKSCLTCGYRTLNPQQCPLIGYSYTEDRNQVCPYWIPELPVCDICGKISPQFSWFQNCEGIWRRECENCAKTSGTCGSCTQKNECDFETNPSPLPKAVQKQIRQGNQILVTTVINKERIRETCMKNCECFSEEFGCLKENGCCNKYNREY